MRTNNQHLLQILNTEDEKFNSHPKVKKIRLNTRRNNHPKSETLLSFKIVHTSYKKISIRVRSFCHHTGIGCLKANVIPISIIYGIKYKLRK